MAVTWDDNLDEILAADLTAALAYRTPAGGVVVQAVAPIGLRDRERGMVGFTTSLGFSKKLERIAADPRVAMAFHAREHGRATTSRYVLVQGSAHVIEQPSAATRDLIRTQAAAYLGPPREGLFWDRWLREYYVSRVPVVISVTRILTWPALDAAGAPLTAGGEPLPSAAAEPQRPPKNGTGPRIDVARAAKRLRATAHTLLVYAGPDGMPVVVPVDIVADDEGGLTLGCGPAAGGPARGPARSQLPTAADRPHDPPAHRLAGRARRDRRALRAPHGDRLPSAPQQDTAAAAQRRAGQEGRQAGRPQAASDDRAAV